MSKKKSSLICSRIITVTCIQVDFRLSYQFRKFHVAKMAKGPNNCYCDAEFPFRAKVIVAEIRANIIRPRSYPIPT